MGKKIAVSHLVYIIVIALIVLSFFLVIAFGGSETAGQMMGTAATVSSLILSVIAIVLSLTDVTGQRDSMVDLKQTAEKLHKTNESAVSLNNDVVEKMVELQEMKDQMIKAMTDSDEWRKELVGKIEGIKEKGDYKGDDLEKILNDLNDERMNESFSRISSVLKHNNKRDTTKLVNVRNFLSHNYDGGDLINYNVLYEIIKNEFGLNQYSINEIISYLKATDFLDIQDNTVRFI